MLSQKTVKPWKFAGFFSLYAVISFMIYLGAGNSIAAWIIHFLAVAPMYLSCLLSFIGLAAMKVARSDDRVIRFRLIYVYLIAIVQIFSILVNRSGACKMNNAGYNFIQSWFTPVDSCTSMPWFPDQIWVGSLQVYDVLLLIFLIDTYILTIRPPRF